ncbi:B12-binding domain-containing radical SAM protein, partial [bacterium]|nr:B12-binding domain-containing radical SAM protein [bacterium]
ISNVPVVLGGIHATILPEQTMKEKNIDFILHGECDLSFHELIKAIEGKKSLDEVEGLYQRNNGSIYNKLPSQSVRNLEDLPPLPYELIEIDRYVTLDKFGNRRFEIKTSRGCPCLCNFCHQTIFRRKWRAYSSEKTLEEILLFKDKHGIKHFHILDDNFFVNLKRSFDIIKGLDQGKYDIMYSINGCRIYDLDRMDEDMLKLLESTGCFELQVGLESGSQKMLDIMKKGTNIEQIKRVNEKMSKYNINIFYEVVCGHPYETDEDLKMTTDLLLQLSKVNQNSFFSQMESLTPYPGTEFYDQAIKSGFKAPESAKEWAKFTWDHFNAPWISTEKKKKLLLINVLPIFITAKTKISNSKIVHLCLKLYRNVARFRMKYHFLKFPIELKIINFVINTGFRFHV